MYTIYYERDGCEHRVPVVFGEKQLAMENACELLRLGFRVLRVQGPGFSIGAAALHEYRRTTSARVHGQTLRRKRRYADRRRNKVRRPMTMTRWRPPTPINRCARR
jgi:hypothetical protein